MNNKWIPFKPKGPKPEVGNLCFNCDHQKVSINAIPCCKCKGKNRERWTPKLEPKPEVKKWCSDCASSSLKNNEYPCNECNGNESKWTPKVEPKVDFESKYKKVCVELDDANKKINASATSLKESGEYYRKLLIRHDKLLCETRESKPKDKQYEALQKLYKLEKEITQALSKRIEKLKRSDQSKNEFKSESELNLNLGFLKFHKKTEY